MPGRSARVRWKIAFTLTSIISSHSSGVMRNSGFLVITPALLTSTSASMPAIARSIVAGSVRSRGCTAHSPPAAVISLASDSSFLVSRAIATMAYVCANRVAMARPIPRDAPVTTAVGLRATGDRDPVQDPPGQLHRKCQRRNRDAFIMSMHAALVAFAERERQDPVRFHAGETQWRTVGGASAQEWYRRDAGCQFGDRITNRGEHGRL